jgi:hypothetical protein
MGDVMVKAAGRPWPAVIAGAAGLDECFVVGDRRGAIPATRDAEWVDQLRALIASLHSDIRAPVG